MVAFSTAGANIFVLAIDFLICFSHRSHSSLCHGHAHFTSISQRPYSHICPSLCARQFEHQTSIYLHACVSHNHFLTQFTMSSLELIRQALVELVDDMNGENPDNVDSQAAATNICNMALADVKSQEAGNASSYMRICPAGV